MDIFAEVTKPTLSNAVYVMRHGRTVLDDEHRSDGWLDYPLSDDGRIGLINAQQYLKLAPITKVYCSTLRRTEETAHIIASGILTHPKVHADDTIRTWNLGALVGTKKKPNRPVVKFYMSHPDQTPVGGESLQDFQGRFLPWIFALVRGVQKGGGPCLVVTSGSNLREISRALTGSVDTFDLDESGLLMLTGHSQGIKGEVLFGHKDDGSNLDS